MEKEYAVIVHRGVDLEAFDAEMAASQGHGPIPNRSVDVANPRLGSRRMTHWMITDTEAEELRADPRVLAVEIPPDQRDDIQMIKNATQSASFYRGNRQTATDVNWGLRRSISLINIYENNTTISNDSGYEYALDGTGVDIVIQDSGIQSNHPEWQDANGVSRLQQIDWYTASGLPGTQSAQHYRDYDGHGTHVASTAAGKTYGWAKGAHIYSQKLAGLEGAGDLGTGIPTADAFDAIRLWHLAKTNGRPTVVNMSWGYVVPNVTSDPTGGTYRGTSWTFTTQTDTQLWDSYGIVAKFSGSDGDPDYRRLPSQNAFADAEVEDMIDAGIHVCIASGNDYYKGDVFGGADYDNFVTINGQNRYYHRPASPYSDRAFFVGNMDSDTIQEDVGFGIILDKDRTAGSSKKGPAVNIWAPGTNITAAMSIINDGGSVTSPVLDYPDNSTYKTQNLSGTSMASPQVAGVLALYLQSQPHATPEQLMNKIIADSVDFMYTTANNDTDYRAYTTSLMGSPNRVLYCRYGRQPYNITGSINITR